MKLIVRRYAIRWLGLAATVTGVVLWIAGSGAGKTVAVVGAFVTVGFFGDPVRSWYLGQAIPRSRYAAKYFAADRFEEAAAEAARWVQCTRKLAFARPAELARLGQALSTQWTSLTKLERHADALVVAEEAVAVRRILAANCNDQLYLAEALELLECSLAELPTDRIGPLADELIMVRAELADDANRKHARALALVADRHVELQEYEAAHPLMEQVVRIHRNLASTNAAHRLRLRGALTDLGDCLTDLGEHERARAAHAEALEIGRATDTTEPIRLAGLLLQLGGSLRELQRYDEAVDVHEEAVAICRADLNSDRPNESAAEVLTWALGELGDDLRDLHRPEEALDAYREALQIGRDSDPPLNFGYALQQVIHTLRALGRHDEARPLEDDLAALQT